MPLLPNYREDKTTQLAGLLLEMQGGSMTRMRLLKLLYLIDREAIQKWDWPVTFDTYVSMEHGPVLSTTYNLIKTPSAGRYWGRFIGEGTGPAVVLAEETPTDQLSEAEIELAEEVFNRYSGWSDWKLRTYTHSLEEWEDPGNSSLAIDFEKLLRSVGKSDEERKEIVEELEACALEERNPA